MDSEEDIARNTFRDGAVHVMRERCKTCIFGPNALLKGTKSGRNHMAEVIAAARAEKMSGNVVCHNTTEREKNAMCRGFAEANPPRALRIAEMMGGVCEQEDNEEQTCEENHGRLPQ